MPKSSKKNMPKSPESPESPESSTSGLAGIGEGLMTGVDAYGAFRIYVSIFVSTLVSIIMMYAAYYFYTKEDRDMVTTDGVALADSVCEVVKDAETCHVEVEYTDSAGEKYKFNLIESGLRLKSGDTVKIEYPKDDPSDGQKCCRIKNKVFGHFMLGGSIFFAMMAGIAYYLRNNKFYRTASGLGGATQFFQ